MPGRTGVAAVSAWLYVPAGRRCVVGAVPPVELRVGNTGTDDVWFPGVLDGSETASRFPIYRPAVLGATDEVVAEPPAPEDGLVGPLRRTDFHRLRPGETFDPTSRGRFLPLSTFATFTPAVPGTYRYRLLIDTTAEDPGAWLGKFGQQAYTDEVLPLLAGVPRVRFVTALDVDVGPAAPGTGS
ncbi:hypothetical protein [Prauserella muralis]|uniref:Uncharacterized protein n=1 Tax=Prauserella muralis TaxID=588067 RepID=A0A2V4B7T8_9PSEU|nr:hypothetical protein [Prauserella muralis]PXY31310.1 hypothetical protein BAY60_02630 [Prauserella muralis]TWE14372.1 hypothetical protein FHX69_6517 [Prauserella muralis]